MRAMDTKTQQTLDELFARLKAGDKSAIDLIVAAYNARQVERRGAPSVRVQGWKAIVT